MLIQLIQDRAEERFLETLEEINQKSVNRGVLFCAFSHVPLKVDPDAVLAFLKDILRDQSGELYFFTDGDVAVCWRGRVKEVLEPMIKGFIDRYREKLEFLDREKLFRFYDGHVHGEDLRLLVRAKLKQRKEVEEKTKPQEEPPASVVVWKAEFSEEQQRVLQKGKINRVARKEPEFLIVEDQDFSRKLLAGMLGVHYRCHVAKNAEEAAALYTEYAPDIAFLDVELPDVDGHTLAGLFKKHDPESFIVMVTGNNYVKDVEAAKANKVQGFIVKPYNKLKIMGAVDAFMSKRKKG